MRTMEELRNEVESYAQQEGIICDENMPQLRAKLVREGYIDGTIEQDEALGTALNQLVTDSRLEVAMREGRQSICLRPVNLLVQARRPAKPTPPLTARRAF